MPRVYHHGNLMKIPYRLSFRLSTGRNYSKAFATLEEAVHVRFCIEYEREVYKALLLPHCHTYLLQSRPLKTFHQPDDHD